MRPGFLIALLLLLALLGGCFYTAYKPVWQFDHWEQHARKAITGTELQVWATYLLDEYPTMETNYAWISQLRTNYPQQLHRLAPRLGPFVYISAGDANRLPCVHLWWGSGFLGAKGFYIGRTNFVMDGGLGRGLMWQPGVYFYRR